MNSDKSIDTPIPSGVYADLNVFRKVGAGEVVVEDLGPVTILYANEHLVELARNGSEAATAQFLCGIRDFEASKLVVDGKGSASLLGRESEDVIHAQIDDIKSDSSQAGSDFLLGMFSRFIGGISDADLRESYHQLVGYLLGVIGAAGPELGDYARKKISPDAVRSVVEDVLDSPRRVANVDVIRKAAGFTSSVRSELEQSSDFMQAVRDHGVGVGLSPEEIFATECPVVAGLSPRERIFVSYMMFALYGIYSESKLTKMSTLNRVQSDAFHVVNASYCGKLLTFDKRMAMKADLVMNSFGVSTETVDLSHLRGSISVSFEAGPP